MLDREDAACIRGFLVNKFRGDPTLFEYGMRAIENHTGWPALGLIPWFAEAARLPAEDAVALIQRPERRQRKGVSIAVPMTALHRQFR